MCAALLVALALLPASTAEAADIAKFEGTWRLDLKRGGGPYIKIYGGSGGDSGGGYMDLDPKTTGGYQLKFILGRFGETVINDGVSNIHIAEQIDPQTGELFLSDVNSYAVVATARLVPGKPDRLVVKGSCIDGSYLGTNSYRYTYEYEFLREGQGVTSGKGHGQSAKEAFRPDWAWMAGEWRPVSGGAMEVLFNLNTSVGIWLGDEFHDTSLAWNEEKRAYVLSTMYEAARGGGKKIIKGYLRTPDGTRGPSDTLEFEYSNEYPSRNIGYGKNGRLKRNAVLAKRSTLKPKPTFLAGWNPITIASDDADIREAPDAISSGNAYSSMNISGWKPDSAVQFILNVKEAGKYTVSLYYAQPSAKGKFENWRISCGGESVTGPLPTKEQSDWASTQRDVGTFSLPAGETVLRIEPPKSGTRDYAMRLFSVVVRPAAAPKTDAITLTANDADLSKAPDVTTDYPKDTLAKWTPNNVVSFPLKAPKAGRYEICLLYTKQEHDCDTADLRITAGENSITAPLPPTKATWFFFEEYDFGVLYLSGNETALSFESTDPQGDKRVMNLRAVRLTPVE